MHPYREASARPPLAPPVARPPLRVGDGVRLRGTMRDGRVTMIEPDGPVYVVAFAPDSCGLFFRSQLLKLVP